MNTKNKFSSGWIYNLADYRQMFDLSDRDLNRSLLDFPGGISSFNAEMNALGHSVISGDDLYDLSPEVMIEQAEVIFREDEAHLRVHLDQVTAHDEEAIADLLARWQQSKKTFLEDYEIGKKEARYQIMHLPTLPLEFHQFQLLLCSAALFHTEVIETQSPEELLGELCRVAEEIRVFPLLNEKGLISDAIAPLMMDVQQKNFGVELKEVVYEQQKGGNAMLRVWAKECVV